MADICYLLFWQWTVQLTPTSMQKVCKESIYEENVPLQLSSVLFNEMSVNTTKPHFVWHDMTLLLNSVFKLYNYDIWGFFNLIFYWPYVYLIALQKIYGEVMTLHFPFGKRWVVLNSPEAIRQGFIKNADYLSERPPSHKGLIFNCKLLCLGFAMVVVWESTVVWTLTVLGALRW